MVHPSRIPGSEKRLGEPWIYFSTRDKIYSLLAIVGIFVIISVAFGSLDSTKPADEPNDSTTTTNG